MGILPDIRFLFCFTCAALSAQTSSELSLIIKKAGEGDAKSQYQLGEYYLDASHGKTLEDAISLINKAAEQGLAEAQYKMGYAHTCLWVTKPSEAEAKKWYKLAAAQGNIEAMVMLGFQSIKESQRVSEPDEQASRSKLRNEAIGWFTQAGDAGDRGAQFELGEIYSRANEPGANENSRDYKTAMTWYMKAAKSKHPHPGAMYRLGMIYLEGKGGEVDIEIAIKWLELASQGGANLANDALAEIYRSGKGVPKNPAKALTLLRQAAENGMYKAQLELGLMLFYGDGVERDEAEAYKLLNEYVTDRSWPDPRALNALGHMLDDGKVTPKDPERAFKYHLLGAEAGLITSQFSVAYAYQTGRGTKLNLVEAVKWYREAAEEGLPIAQCNLGKILMSGGLGVAADPVEGFSWSLRAAMSGLSEAQMGVAIHLYTGTGTPKDYVEAYAWANIAAAGGNVARAKELRDEIEMKLDPAQLAEAQKRSKTLNEKIAEEVIGSHRRQRAKELLERKGA